MSQVRHLIYTKLLYNQNTNIYCRHTCEINVRLSKTLKT